MRGAEHDVDEAGMARDDVGQGLDDILDALVGRKQAEGEHDRSAGDFELVFVETGIGEGGSGDAVGNDGELAFIHAVEAEEHAAGALGHDDDAGGKIEEFGEDAALVGIGIFQHRMQGGDHRHAHAAEEGEQVAAGRAAVDAELVLHAEGVHVREVEEVGRADIGGDVGLGNFEADGVRVGVGAGAVGHGDDGAVPVRVHGNHRITQIAREGGDAALPGRIVAEKGYFGYRRRSSHSSPFWSGDLKGQR